MTPLGSILVTILITLSTGGVTCTYMYLYMYVYSTGFMHPVCHATLYMYMYDAQRPKEDLHFTSAMNSFESCIVVVVRIRPAIFKISQVLIRRSD